MNDFLDGPSMPEAPDSPKEALEKINKAIVPPSSDDLFKDRSYERYLGLDTTKVTYLDSGTDSIVLSLKESPHIVKVYGPINGRVPTPDRPLSNLNLDQVRRYQGLIDEAKVVLEGAQYDYKLTANPISELGVLDEKTPIAISDKIDGVRMSDLMSGNVKSDINIGREELGRVYNDLHHILGDNIQTKPVDGVTVGWREIGPENVMVRKSDAGEVEFVLTDLFRDVGGGLKRAV